MPYIVRSKSLAATLRIAKQLNDSRIQARMIRTLEFIKRKSAEALRPSERFYSSLDPDGLGIWLGVISPTPRPLLAKLQQLALPNFELLDFQEKSGCYWGHFRSK